jgi:hypothetical protein
VLVVTGIKFTGDAAGRLWHEGKCIGKLHRGETCSFTVRVKPGAAGQAQIRIQQNLEGPASLVNVELDAITAVTDEPFPPDPPPSSAATPR